MVFRRGKENLWTRGKKVGKRSSVGGAFLDPVQLPDTSRKSLVERVETGTQKAQALVPALPLTAYDLDSNTNLSLVYCPQLPGKEAALGGPKVPSIANIL